MFAVDAGSTQGVAQTIQKHSAAATVKGGGYDLLPVTEELLASGNIEFTIDQQPYLQGFFPILELFLYNVSKKLSGIADVDTGLKFLTKETVVPYNTTKSRFEGSSSAVGVVLGSSCGGRIRQRSSGTSSIRGPVQHEPGPRGRA